ncbi:MAG: hypothetical protein MHMPM18_000828 [Marteilia pararefringens]
MKEVQRCCICLLWDKIVGSEINGYQPILPDSTLGEMFVQNDSESADASEAGKNRKNYMHHGVLCCYSRAIIVGLSKVQLQWTSAPPANARSERTMPQCKVLQSPVRLSRHH